MNRNVDVIAIIVLLLGFMVVAETHSALSVVFHKHRLHIDRDSGAVFDIPEPRQPPVPPAPNVSFSFD